MGEFGHDDGSWAVTRFFRDEVFDAQKLPSNLGVLYGVGVFAGAVYFLEHYAELLVQ
ncbi:hypothetical protein GGI26_002977 [Coemansia sp. RSA 1358]|uniref:Uncharacterized protein n=1 Tax=Coemansia umbellata TaxID=1424467 RepID=A0ABQ8PQI0_9FUNG|nr:hypothetical protein EDC05_001854 [Coemansia umbellata]KAJ2622708.1 hypothetical protein GGI26_002977 [Coemansia sp. RSA 1358]